MNVISVNFSNQLRNQPRTLSVVANRKQVLELGQLNRFFVKVLDFVVFEVGFKLKTRIGGQEHE